MNGVESRRGKWKGREWRAWPVMAALAWWALAMPGGLSRTAGAAELTDRFADRQRVLEASGSAQGSSVNATVEPREPRHGGKRGGRSLWISWTAPEGGIAAFDTRGSDFDTLLSVYELEEKDPDKPEMERLKEVARGDDDGPDRESAVHFAAKQGATYEIAVDGYNGAGGLARLQWSLLASDDDLPVIARVPADRALRVGDAVTLTVDYELDDDDDDVKLAWLYNGDDTLGAEEATLTIPNFQPANVGRYQLRFTVGDIRLVSAPIELQVNSEGEVLVLARDKILDAVESALIGQADARSGGLARVQRARTLGMREEAAIGVSRGYNGVQIFSTLFAGREAGEPAHCGVMGGGSYWLAYQAPARGSLTLDTDGSNFDTVLAVYTYDSPLAGFESLRAVVCDDNGGANGLTSRVRFETEASRHYLIAVEGVNGARGAAHLRYELRPLAAAPPRLIRPPESRSARLGETLAWRVEAEGTAPLRFQWLRQGVALPGGAAALLEFPRVRLEDAGFYTVRISNEAGSITTDPVALAVLAPAEIALEPDSSSAFVHIAATPGLEYALESADALAPVAWAPVVRGVADGDRIGLRQRLVPGGAAFFRFRFTPVVVTPAMPASVPPP